MSGILKYWKNWKNVLKVKHPFIYFFFFQLPWYRVTTVLLLVQVFSLKTDIRKLEKENLELTKVNSSIIVNQIARSKLIDKIPKSIWYKVKKGNRYIFQLCNKHYENKWLKPKGYSRYDYYGYTDFQIYGFYAAKKFQYGDSLTANSSKPMELNESFTDDFGNDYDINVIKWREITEEQDTIVWGMEL